MDLSRTLRLQRMFVALVISFSGAAIGAANEISAAPPCGGSLPQPGYAPVGAPPNVQIWKDQSLAGFPDRVACLGWSTPKFRMLIAVAGTFRNSEGALALMSRFGAVSTLLSVRYWSTTDQSWRPLVLSATALTGRVASQTRADFTPAELEGGKDVYLAQADSRGAGEVTYRMRVRESNPSGFIIETENVTSVRWLALTLLRAGGMYSVYFVQQRSPGIWSYYSLTKIAKTS